MFATKVNDKYSKQQEYVKSNETFPTIFRNIEEKSGKFYPTNEKILSTYIKDFVALGSQKWKLAHVFQRAKVKERMEISCFVFLLH